MDAFAFVFLALFIIGLLMALYYGFLCIPMYLHDKKPLLPHDPERDRILSLDDNENVGVPIPNHANAIPLQTVEPRRSDSIPSSPAQEDAAPNVNQEYPSLDTPDHVVIPSQPHQNTTPVRTENLQSEAPHTSFEKQPLLQGDEEDGLIYCGVAGLPGVAVVSGTSKEGTPVQDTVPQDVVIDCENQQPSHVIVNVPEAQSVPPEKSIALEHPVSHPVVSAPQSLNVIPMVAVPPVYDESPTDEQTPTSLQDRVYHQTPTLRVTSSKPTGKEENPEKVSYGWSEDLEGKPSVIVGNKEEKQLSRSASVGSVDNKNEEETDTSDAEITEYTLNGSSEQVQGQSPALVSESPLPPVKLVRYTSLTEQSRGQKEEIVDENTKIVTASPELTRRSPDGDSVRSLEQEPPQTSKNEGTTQSTYDIEQIKKSKVEVVDSGIL